MSHLPQQSLVALLAALPLVAQTATERAFLRGLARIEAVARTGASETALVNLLELLQDHADADYARHRRLEIETLHKLCAFRMRLRTPALRELLGGEILAADVASGLVKLRYTKGNLAEWTKVGDHWVFDARFCGPHALELKGGSYTATGGEPGAAALLLTCVEDTRELRLSCGLEGVRGPWLERKQATGTTKLAAAESSPCRSGRPYKLRLQVGETTLKVSWNGGAPFLVANKERGEWGRLGFGRIEFDEVTVEGKVEPAWLQEKLDYATSDQLREFEKSYDPRRALPAWLYVRNYVRDTERDRAEAWPDPLDEVQAQIVHEAERAFARREYENGLRFVTSYSPAEVPLATLTAMRLGFLTALERYEEAEATVRELERLAPDCALVQALTAELWIATGRGSAALKLAEPLVAKWPLSERYALAQALARMVRGELALAKRAVDDAHARGVAGPDLEALNRTLVKALRGPEWTGEHAHRTTHYEVRTDIDPRLCVQATQLLESAFAEFAQQHGTPPVASGLHKVFLFRGPESFHRHIEQLWGKRICPNVAGVYHPLLKQLLIWNLPRRDEMFATIRHEAFHQYLDRMMPTPPIWLDEGLAVHHEHALAPGEPEPKSLAVLRKQGLKPLAGFVLQSPEAFYNDGERNYAQAWAFVAFLLRKEQRKYFDLLWKELAAGSLPEPAVRKAFAGVAWEQLDRELLVFVQGLK